jgi:hypothetical protein
VFVVWFVLLARTADLSRLQEVRWRFAFNGALGVIQSGE